MRALLLTLVLSATAAAQSAPTIVVTDETGVAIPSARITLQSPTQPALHCETNFAGRCSLPSLPSGQYDLKIEKENFYALTQTIDLAPGFAIDVTLNHQQEVREVVDVRESPPAIDPAQVSAQETITGLDVINIVYPVTHDYRNAINFIPGVVSDQFGQPHVAGAQTYQTETVLDGFNVTQPANGQLIIRVSTDAFRSIQIQPSREPAEDGKASGGVLSLNTGIGDDHFRFSATDFIPSFQDKHGLRFDQFLPRFTFSGPIKMRRAWFYNAFDGEYSNVIYTELPVGQDNDHVLRFGNLAKVQTNITSRNILTSSFLFNHLRDQYGLLSPYSPQLTNPRNESHADIASIKDQHYFAGGQLLETGFAFEQYNAKLTPYGAEAYQVTPTTAFGNYYLGSETRARRWQGLMNLYLPPRHWLGRHDFKLGLDVDRLSYDSQFARQPITFLTSTVSSAQPANVCFTAVQDATFPCTRYSTFTPAPLHTEFNAEVSAYLEDRWSVTNRLLIEPGIRLDWDEIVNTVEISPRLAGTYVLDNSATTKISAGAGLVYDATPIFLIARPFAGTREDTFFSIPNATTCSQPNCVVTTGPFTATFSANTSDIEAPRFLNWSLGLEKKLPAAIYLKAEFLEKRGITGLVYDASPVTSTNFVLRNDRNDHYDAFQLTLRHNFREGYTILGAYTRSRAHSNQALDFNVDSPILSPQQPGPYPWDTPNRFLTWGYLPFFKLPFLHQTEIAYSAEARTGFPFGLLNDQQQLISTPGAERFPFYFSANLQLEKRFHLFGYYLALRGGFDNITGRCNPFDVNAVIDATNPQPIFSACQGRSFTSRIRLLGRKK